MPDEEAAWIADPAGSLARPTSERFAKPTRLPIRFMPTPTRSPRAKSSSGKPP